MKKFYLIVLILGSFGGIFYLSGSYRNNLKNRFLEASICPNTSNSRTHGTSQKQEFSLQANFEEPCQTPDSLISFDLLQNYPLEKLTELPQEDLKHYHFFRNNFETHYHKNKINESLKIPKIIHFIWIGPKPFPQRSIANLQSWIQHHPGWEIQFWTDDPMREVPVQGIKRRLIKEVELGELSENYNQSSNYAQKADILRYVILKKWGGVYSDHDIVCYQSLEYLHYNYDFYCGLESIKQFMTGGPFVYPGNCWIGSKPNHPVILAALEYIRQNWNIMKSKYEKETDQILATTFLSLHFSVLSHLNEGLNIDMVLPATFICGSSIWNSDHFQTWIDKKIVLCNHLYDGTWFKPDQ